MKHKRKPTPTGRADHEVVRVGNSLIPILGTVGGTAEESRQTARNIGLLSRLSPAPTVLLPSPNQPWPQKLIPMNTRNRLPYALEFRRWNSAHRRRLAAARGGLACGLILAGMGLGSLVPLASLPQLIFGLAVLAWCGWSIYYLLTRHH